MTDSSSVKKLQNYYDQLFPMAVQEFLYFTMFMTCADEL
jgi:hypothetical protein